MLLYDESKLRNYKHNILFYYTVKIFLQNNLIFTGCLVVYNSRKVILMNL